jgi:DNA repair exonuclease SbcCD ATPase subunit
MRYLSVPDFHFSPKWGEESMKIARKVAREAKKHEVDLIVLPGDLYDAPIMVTDKGGINKLRKIVKLWLDVCPVVAIEGTPSHDGQGCYGPLEDMGLVLLKPGNMYGLSNGKIDKATSDSQLLLFGVPEIDKHSIQARLELSAEKANGKALELFEQYLTEFVGPSRAMFPNIPALGLLHGNVSDAHKENTSDIILRSSDIVIHTEMLEIAGLDRWEFGHIHTPWESEVINAGYAGYPGIDHNPWGKRDFVPAMNLGDMTTVERIHYGTPMRKKIYKPLDTYDPAIAYWLVSKEADYHFPDGMHPWSRITFDEQRKETRRVTAEQAESVKKLSDLFMLIDPEVSPDAIELVDTIPESSAHMGKPVDLRMTKLEVQGCIFFRGKTVVFDLAGLSDGVTAIKGDNGSGKSSLLSFCTPYPLVVGKDTSSGRISAIKDFFVGKESLIKKEFLVNGSKHKHLITIKGAHTQSPKVECYLTIDGQPMLEKGSFDEMMEECERIYGPFSDYRLTTFYEQPLQSPKSTSSLMSASMTDIRNLVQNIAGIDREQEKRYALDRLSECESQAEKLNNWVVGALSMCEDEQSLVALKQGHIEAKPALMEKISESEAIGKKLKEKLDKLHIRKSESDSERRRKSTDYQNMDKLKSANEQIGRQVIAIRESQSEVEAIKKQLSDNDLHVAECKRIDELEHKAKQQQWEYDTKVSEIAKMRRDWQDDIQRVIRANENATSEFMSQQKMIVRDIEVSEASINAAKRKIEAYDNPCPKCGYIEPDAEKIIDANKKNIESIEKHIQDKQAELKSLKQPLPVKEPEKPAKLVEAEKNLGERPSFDVPKKPACLSTFEVNMLQDTLSDAENADARISALEERYKTNAETIATIEAEVYQIVDDIDMLLEDASSSYEQERKNWSDLHSELSTIDARISDVEQRIERAKAQRDAIDKSRLEAESATKKASIWKYISGMLMPSKIPALELELLLDSIDAEATRIIEPYHEGQFAIRTETQSEGKQGSVDRFDIMIYDAETGEERSFMKHSPGQKAFFSDAYVKALVRQRNQRSQRSYAPVIMDESDGPIQPELVGQYYEMQRRYWDLPVLVVSHSPASHEHIEYAIDIEEVKQG